jgi:DNA-binding HxlR family transcriptional regulator
VEVRRYGQYCGFARALEVVGERWAFLIIRDLLVGDQRFTDLLQGLPGIPTNVLTARLKQLEQAGVVQRKVLPRPAGSVVYELTNYGKELEETVYELGRWGAKKLGDPRPNEIATPNALVTALRSTFRPEAARGLRASYELRMGPFVIHAYIHNGSLEAGPGPLTDADLVIETGPGIKGVMAHEITPAEAVKNKVVHLRGDRKLFDRFAEIFRI